MGHRILIQRKIQPARWCFLFLLVCAAEGSLAEASLLMRREAMRDTNEVLPIEHHLSSSRSIFVSHKGHVLPSISVSVPSVLEAEHLQHQHLDTGFQRFQHSAYTWVPASRFAIAIVILLSILVNALVVYCVISQVSKRSGNRSQRLASGGGRVRFPESGASSTGSAPLEEVQYIGSRYDKGNFSRGTIDRTHDFERSNKALRGSIRGGATLFKWCTEDAYTGLGVMTEGTAHIFEDFKSLNFTPDADALEGLLKRFNHIGDADAIEKLSNMLLCRQCTFMAKISDSGIMLLTDRVVLRVVVGSHILVEEADDDEGQMVKRLPTSFKIKGECPEHCAQSLWTKVTSLPGEHARFVEYTMEQSENRLESFKGLRSVTRTFVVVAELIGDDPKVRETLQVPADDSEAKGPGTVDESRPPTPMVDKSKRFQRSWTADMHKDFALKWLPLRDVDRPDVSIDRSIALAKVHLFLGPIDELGAFLTAGGINTDSWNGEKHTRTLNALAADVEQGLCILQTDEERTQITRHVNVVTLRLRLPSESDSRMLVEVGKRNANGDVKWKAQLPGCSHKVGESVEDSVRHYCMTGLNLSEDDIDILGETSRDYVAFAQNSNTYPGLKTVYHRFLVDVLLSDEARDILPADFVADMADGHHAGSGASISERRQTGKR